MQELQGVHAESELSDICTSTSKMKGLGSLYVHGESINKQITHDYHMTHIRLSHNYQQYNVLSPLTLSSW